MVDAINGVLEAVMASPWAYLAIFLVSAVDAFFPVVPSETAVIAAGVLAAAGKQTLLWVILLGASGAFAGDHVSYLIGRFLGRPAIERLLRGQRGHRARAWATQTLRTRGGLMIVVCRFIPGGRTATTLAAGALSYPVARFSAFDALAALCWATYAGLIGYFTGEAFRSNPLLAVAAGIGFAAGLSAVVELARWLQRRRRGSFASANGGSQGQEGLIPAAPTAASLAKSARNIVRLALPTLSQLVVLLLLLPSGRDPAGVAPTHGGYRPGHPVPLGRA